MKTKLKSLREFKNESVLELSDLKLIHGGTGDQTEYYVGECTDVYAGGDCRNLGFFDNGASSGYVGPIIQTISAC